MERVDVRCPACHIMLARVVDGGAMEIRRGGRVLAVVARGDLYCSNCDVVVAIRRSVSSTRLVAFYSDEKMVYTAARSARSEE